MLIGHPRGGTALAVMQAVVGSRARLILPVGLEKRIPGDLMELAARLNAPGSSGFRLLTGAEAELLAGVGGAEGAVWLALSGSEVEMRRAGELMREVSTEKGIEL